MADAPRVLLVEHEKSLGRLFLSVLEDEGFEVEMVLEPEDLVAEVRRSQPALLVLDLLPPAEAAMETLDALRTDDVARAVPIVVLTTVDTVFQEGSSSYNVRAVLQKPFELDDFIDAAHQYAETPTLHSRVEAPRPAGDDFPSYAEQVLANRSRQIVFRWMQRIRTQSPWRERSLETQELIDYAPRILELVDVRLHYASHQEFFERHPEALERAADHARMRMSQDIGLIPAIAEYMMVREEIWREFRMGEHVAGDLPSFLDAEAAINGTLDAVVVATVTAYLREVAGV